MKAVFYRQELPGKGIAQTGALLNFLAVLEGGPCGQTGVTLEQSFRRGLLPDTRGANRLGGLGVG